MPDNIWDDLRKEINDRRYRVTYTTGAKA
jgi:hypothetical protein